MTRGILGFLARWSALCPARPVAPWRRSTVRWRPGRGSPEGGGPVRELDECGSTARSPRPASWTGRSGSGRPRKVDAGDDGIARLSRVKVITGLVTARRPARSLAFIDSGILGPI